jgi:sarcosine oxidase, subunit gamma
MAKSAALPAGMRQLPPLGRLSLRGDPPALAAAGTALGFALSSIACRSSAAGEIAALWLGPDEQLLLGPQAEMRVMGQRLTEALRGMRHSVVDISDRQLAFELSGQEVTGMLAIGCPLDLDEASFPVGMCTRTLLGKAGIVLWRTASQCFHLEVARSYVAYTRRFLTEAGRELGC